MIIFFLRSAMEALNHKPNNLNKFDDLLSVLFDSEVVRDKPDMDYLQYLAELKEGESQEREIAVKKLTEELKASLFPFRYMPELEKELNERLISGSDVSDFMRSIVNSQENSIGRAP